MHSISQFHLEDESGSMRLSGNPSPNYLTIQNLPRRNRSYLQLENNLRNLFDSPPSHPPHEGPPSSTPPPAINEPAGYLDGHKVRTRTST